MCPLPTDPSAPDPRRQGGRHEGVRDTGPIRSPEQEDRSAGHEARSARSEHRPGEQERAAGSPRPTGPATAGVSPGSTFAPISLRPAVDVAVVEERLRRLGQTRSTSALAERAELLRLLGRLDEALVVAEETFRLALFTGDRADGVAARIRRAHVLHDLGRYERAVSEASMARDTAAIEEWAELEGAAAELEGWSLYELGRYEEARTVLGRAHDAFRAAGASPERTGALQSAIEESMRAFIKHPKASDADSENAAWAAAARTEQER